MVQSSVLSPSLVTNENCFCCQHKLTNFHLLDSSPLSDMCLQAFSLSLWHVILLTLSFRANAFNFNEVLLSFFSFMDCTFGVVFTHCQNQDHLDFSPKFFPQKFYSLHFTFRCMIILKLILGKV